VFGVQVGTDSEPGGGGRGANQVEGLGVVGERLTAAVPASVPIGQTAAPVSNSLAQNTLCSTSALSALLLYSCCLLSATPVSITTHRSGSPMTCPSANLASTIVSWLSKGT
jgi:hypothetical protein